MILVRNYRESSKTSLAAESAEYAVVYLVSRRKSENLCMENTILPHIILDYPRIHNYRLYLSWRITLSLPAKEMALVNPK